LPRSLIFDISTLARSPGTATGIVRTVRELARWAHAHRPGTVFVVFDWQEECFRQVRPEFFRNLIEGRAALDFSERVISENKHRRFIDGLPRPVRRVGLWYRNPRRRAIMALERRRLLHDTPSPWIERAQQALMREKHRAELFDANGRRIDLLPFEFATGDAIILDSQLLLCAGSDWDAGPIAHVSRRRPEADFRFAFICYDMIPLLHPEFFAPKSARSFRTMFHSVVPLTDVVVVTARQIARDFSAYCADHGIPVPELRTCKLGADLPVQSQSQPAALPTGLEPERYALFVSTIEPRKGHGLLFKIWQRLLAEGIPQAHQFKLVFVGRRGWLVDDLLAEMKAHSSYGESLLVLSGLDDGQLVALYRNAAFGLFPSLYEGYGLPVVEAFNYGKAVLSSNGGSLAEVVGEFSPQLDPTDEEAWYAALKRWITEPAAREPFEEAIRTRYRHPSWPEAAEAFFRILDEEAAPAASVGSVTP
jgi:glycosyltransferase involved in cell wall biosynthesis